MSGITKKQVLETVKSYVILTCGVLVFCSAWGCFMIPNGMSSGGLTGLCTVIQYATAGKIPVAWSYGFFNVILLLMAFAIMGSRFGIKTIYCIILSTVALDIFPMLPQLHCLPDHFISVPAPFFIPLIAGALEGIGLGLLFRQGGSSGGSDILALIVNKYWPISPGRFFLVTDFVIVLSLLLLPDRTFTDLLYGILMIIVSAIMVDRVMMGGKSTVQLMVFSDRYEQIADYIIKEQDRGVTALEAMGWFTKKEKKVLLIIMQQKQLFEVTSVIKSIDSNAFVSVSPASSVYGEGFQEIKSGIRKKKKK